MRGDGIHRRHVEVNQVAKTGGARGHEISSSLGLAVGAAGRTHRTRPPKHLQVNRALDEIITYKKKRIHGQIIEAKNPKRRRGGSE